MKNRSCVPGQSVGKVLHDSMIASDTSNYIPTLDRTNVVDVGNSLLGWTLSIDTVSLYVFFPTSVWILKSMLNFSCSAIRGWCVMQVDAGHWR